MQLISRESFKDHPLLQRLLQLHDIPEQLYVKGTLPHITLDEYGRATPRILTIVGSRNSTSYGAAVVEKLVASLKGYPVVIVSGLAYGIDSLAHKQALNNNLITCAVLGNGLDDSVLYPPSHKSLADDILSSGGTLLSELEPRIRAAKWTFPARNRIVAALSDAILLVETKEKSGTLITARLGLELGRDIGAVPGDIFSETSKGTNALLKDGAQVITTAEDLFELLHLTPPAPTQATLTLNTLESSLIELLSEPKEKDLLLIESKLSLQDFLTTLSSLEMKGYIQETFGEVRRIV